MAATWEIDVTITDEANKEGTFRATRTDGEDVRTYSVTGRIIGPVQAALDRLAGTFYQLHTDKIAEEARIAALVSPVTSGLKTRLEAMEA